MNNIGDISVEQFAAFLDGNLAADEMQRVADAIDGYAALSDLLGDAMAVDDEVEALADLDAIVPDELLSMDFSLPDVVDLQPLVDDSLSDVQLLPTDDTDAHVIELDIAHPIAADTDTSLVAMAPDVDEPFAADEDMNIVDDVDGDMVDFE
ncbi:MAG: hypothetical protein KBT39_07810 [Bacteroidales bacterium]|nr:hypothetical protein [Bacteroidales bacterium]